MKVYLVYKKDGIQVDKIFANNPDAIDYVIEHIFDSGRIYPNKNSEELWKLALNYIIAYNVKGS